MDCQGWPGRLSGKDMEGKVSGKSSLFRLGVWLALMLVVLAGLGWSFRDSLTPLVAQYADSFWAFLKQTNPLVFFGLFAVLPALGCPISPFYLIAPGLYELKWNMLGFGLAIIVNISLGYWIAAGFLRPLAEKLVTRAGHKVPQVDSSNAGKLALVVRITPGVPFCLKNYLLGLAGVPYKTYMWASWPIELAWALAIVIVGESIFEGKAGLGLLGGVFLIALILLTKMARNRYATKSDREEPDSA